MAGTDDFATRARRGDEEAWAALYARHHRRLVTWLTTLPAADAASSPEDIAHEAWLTAAEKIATFRGGDDDFAGWLFGISRNHLLNRRRTAARRATHPTDVHRDDDFWGTAPDPSSDVLDADTVKQLLAQLSTREAEVVACIDVVGLDVASAARALGISSTAVRVARHRALGRLRGLIDPR
ncbi:MAG: sigD 2 [Nocardioidaceae bacterium]|nr:sigD 2 [Nocardioidaceae bacterium]